MSNSAKSRAEERFTASTKKKERFMSEVERERQLKAQHTAKLRTLRLAKEAADEEAASITAAEGAKKPKGKR